MKDAKRTNSVEFDKFIAKQQFALLEYGDKSREVIVNLYRVAWKAALRMIKSEGVISDCEIAGEIIKDELGE